VHLFITDLRRVLCQGLLRLSIALERAELLVTKAPVFGDAREMFHQRFACFRNIAAPTPLPYDDYVHNTNTAGCTVEQLLKLPLEDFGKAFKIGHEVQRTATSYKVRARMYRSTFNSSSK
jgi:hypothetical protein